MPVGPCLGRHCTASLAMRGRKQRSGRDLRVRWGINLVPWLILVLIRMAISLVAVPVLGNWFSPILSPLFVGQMYPVLPPVVVMEGRRGRAIPGAAVVLSRSVESFVIGTGPLSAVCQDESGVVARVSVLSGSMHMCIFSLAG